MIISEIFKKGKIYQYNFLYLFILRKISDEPVRIKDGWYV